MKNSKVFYRSALATAIVMALSAPAFATIARYQLIRLR